MLTLDDDAAHQTVGDDRQIAPMPDRAQEGSGGGAALAPPDGEVVAPNALLFGPVEVVVDGMAGLAARLGRERSLILFVAPQVTLTCL